MLVVAPLYNGVRRRGAVSRVRKDHPQTYHDMANCPVEGSDNFLHLSCVMDDMIFIMKAVLLHLRLAIMQGQVKIRGRTRKSPEGDRAINGPPQS